MADDFLKKWILEPMDDLMFSSMRIAEKAGIWEPFRNLFYQGEGAFYDILFKQLFKFDLSGTEYLEAYNDKAVIYASNHQSLLDPIVSGLSVYKGSGGRQPYQLAKVELFTSPLFNMFSRVNRGIPIRRGESDEVAIEKSIELLNEGHQMVFYPEGTLNPGNGKFLKPHTGIARVVFATKVDVIPMAIYGTDKIYGKNAKMPNLKAKLAVKFGRPLAFEKLFSNNIRTSSNIDPEEMYKAYKKATLKIFSQIQSLWLDLHETFGSESKEKKEPRPQASSDGSENDQTLNQEVAD
jgi:1-acyl-sn-glycerol-3-phosphate acyltransferase